MGKRKRGPDHLDDPSPSDSRQHVPLENLHFEQRSSEPAESNAFQSLPVLEVADSSMERPGAHQAPNLSHFSGRAKLSKHSRYPFSHLYSRRGSSNNSDASPSYWKGPKPYDAKFSFKLENKDLLNFGGIRDRIFTKPERKRSRLFLPNEVSGDTRKMECRLCQKRLRKNPFIPGSSLSSHDLSVVAVLVCGHAYHAYCLEQKTSIEHKHDPPCPVC